MMLQVANIFRNLYVITGHDFESAWKWLDERSGENYIIVFYFQKYKNKAKTQKEPTCRCSELTNKSLNEDIQW